MNPIRPPVLPPAYPAANGAQDMAKLAAAKAFFAAAMGQQAPAPTAASAAPAVQVAQKTSMSAEAPQKLLRPGSLIDIRV